MTVTAITPVPWNRPLWHRVVTALVVVQGGLLWLGGAALFTFCAGRCKDVFDRLEIRSGLPLPTKILLHVNALLSADWTVTCVYLAVVVAFLAMLFALWPSRRAFRCAGWLTVTCFLTWDGMFILLIPSCFLPLIPCC